MCVHCAVPVGTCVFFFFNDTATTEIYTLSLHDALPISTGASMAPAAALIVVNGVLNSCASASSKVDLNSRSEEHTSELQSPCNLVCRLLLEKKKKNIKQHIYQNSKRI